MDRPYPYSFPFDESSVPADIQGEVGIVDMKFKNDYQMMLDAEGQIYSCGKSRDGVLGLGKL